MHTPSITEDSDWSLETVFAERLRFEHELIGQRMTWLMTMNSFVVGSGAVLTAGSGQFDGTHVFSALSLILACLGILSNASCLFSNYWSTRSIHESGLALDATWADLSVVERERLRSNMRLFGRDPREVRERGAPPPSQILHPWLMLPMTFLLFFVALPYLAMAVSADDHDIAIGWCVLIEAVALLPFLVLPLVDVLHHRRRELSPEQDRPDLPKQVERIGAPSELGVEVLRRPGRK